MSLGDFQVLSTCVLHFENIGSLFVRKQQAWKLHQQLRPELYAK